MARKLPGRRAIVTVTQKLEDIISKPPERPFKLLVSLPVEKGHPDYKFRKLPGYSHNFAVNIEGTYGDDKIVRVSDLFKTSRRLHVREARRIVNEIKRAFPEAKLIVGAQKKISVGSFLSSNKRDAAAKAMVRSQKRVASKLGIRQVNLNRKAVKGYDKRVEEYERGRRNRV